MQDSQTNRRAAKPTRVNLFNFAALREAIKAKMEAKEPEKNGSVPMVSAIWRGYAGHTDGRTKSFKQNRRKELKLSSRRRQRRVGR